MCRGFGFVTFVNPTSVDKVLAAGVHQLDAKVVSRTCTTSDICSTRSPRPPWTMTRILRLSICRLEWIFSYSQWRFLPDAVHGQRGARLSSGSQESKQWAYLFTCALILYSIRYRLWKTFLDYMFCGRKQQKQCLLIKTTRAEVYTYILLTMRIHLIVKSTCTAK